MQDQKTQPETNAAIGENLVLLHRIDEGESDATFIGMDAGDRIYEVEISDATKEIWIEGAGGGGGGGGGASGRGAGKGQSGCGAGGNGAYCTAAFKLELRRGDKLNIRLGHGGEGGAGTAALLTWGSSGGRGGDTILSVNEAVFFTFPGSNGGGGGRLPRGDRPGTISGAPSDTNPPSHIANYFFAAGGAQGGKGADVNLPFGGRGGAGGNQNGGGGGGASLRGAGGRGGHYTVPCTDVFMGIEGHFGSGGGGGAGGGAGTCDFGGPGGAGGSGYVWIYRRA